MIFKKKKKLVKNFSILGTDFVLVKKRQVCIRIYDSIENKTNTLQSLDELKIIEFRQGHLPIGANVSRQAERFLRIQLLEYVKKIGDRIFVNKPLYKKGTKFEMQRNYAKLLNKTY